MTETQKAITVALLAFSENFRQAVTEDLTSVWMNTLGDMSMDAIKTGTRRCLTECEFFPSLSVFITKTKKTDMLRPSTWEDAPRLEYQHDKKAMPADVKATVAKLIREATKAKTPFVPFRTVHGTENGLNFTIKQDAEGRDIVEYTNRPEPTATYMRY
jgi:hypothetical protein